MLVCKYISLFVDLIQNISQSGLQSFRYLGIAWFFKPQVDLVLGSSLVLSCDPDLCDLSGWCLIITWHLDPGV